MNKEQAIQELIDLARQLLDDWYDNEESVIKERSGTIAADMQDLDARKAARLARIEELARHACAD